MDPMQFSIDWTQASEALGAIVLLAFFVERALSLVFEHRSFIEFEKNYTKKLKEYIALALAFGIVISVQFDAIAVIFKTEVNSWFGYLITAGIVAGGSKGAVKLFHDVLNIKSNPKLQAEAEENAP